MTVAVVAVAGGLTVFGMMDESFVRLIILSFTSFGLALLTTWFWALDGKERKFFKENIRRIIGKMNVVFNRNK